MNREPTTSPDYYLAGENSGFASLLGCNDRLNTWEPHVYCAFLCNDLTKRNFDCGRANWHLHYKSTAVFPLRYPVGNDGIQKVMGFLTFDSLETGIFGNIPDIYGFTNELRDRYREKLWQSAFVHTCGLLADCLAGMMCEIIGNEERK